jgi:hypothetical protein
VRHLFIWALLSSVLISTLPAADPQSSTLRGRLRQPKGQAPYLETGPGKRVQLLGDDPTVKVLEDERFKDADFEVAGTSISPDRFEINHIHIPSLFFYKDGKRLQVSYWCDVCYIRTSSPGKCWCCQKQTDLDPVEPER